MPSCARAEIIRPEEVSLCHCWNRCVRRAFLRGSDQASGIDYEDRRDWIRDMEGQHVAGLFAIEIGFRGEMSNHLHLVLRTRPDVAGTWSEEDVARRGNWTRDPDALFWGAFEPSETSWWQKTQILQAGQIPKKK
jgi:hypothetical protein